MIKHVFILGYSNSIVERTITQDNDDSVNDDLSPEEIADIKEYYSNKAEHKKMSLEELIKELHE